VNISFIFRYSSGISATQLGAQVRVVRNILSRILGEDAGHVQKTNLHNEPLIQPSQTLTPLINNNLFG